MKILFLTDNFPPERNASATRVYERACYWVEWGHEVTVITCAPNFPEGKIFEDYKNKWYQVENMDGIKVVRVKTFMVSNAGFFLRTLDFLSYMFMAFIVGLFQKKPDIIIATSPQFFAAVGGWFLAFCKCKSFIFELGDLWPASIVAVGAMKKNWILRLLERVELFLYRRSARVVALTHSFKEDLIARGIDPDKIKVVINGVDLKRYAPVSKNENLKEMYGMQDKFIVGYIGTHGMAHGLENVLHAAEILQRENSDIRFMFVGGGAERASLIEKATQLGLKNVIFIPMQPKENISEFWGICDVALVHLKDNPLFKTVIPSKIFEAMGMGLPILLVAPDGEAKTIVLQEKAGNWVPAGKPEIFANAVLEMYQKPKELASFAENSHQAAPKYSREKQAKDMLHVLEEVVGKV